MSLGSSIDGLVCLNKPSGWTSRQALDAAIRVARQAARAAGQATRVTGGHAGTLDPLATGVLVVCLGKATRLVSAIQELPKTYVGSFRFGWTSPTDDVTGELTESPHAVPLERRELEAALHSFRGEILQVPSSVSAVHVDGQRAYDLARAGVEFELQAKPVRIDRLEVTAFDWPHCTLRIECGSGTYIRALGRDLGQRLGCGAVMTSLERTAIGPWMLAHAISPEELTADTLVGRLQPPVVAVRHWPNVVADEPTCRRLSCGQVVPLEEFSQIEGQPRTLLGVEERVAVQTTAGSLWALATVIMGLDGQRLCVRPTAVFGRLE